MFFFTKSSILVFYKKNYRIIAHQNVLLTVFKVIDLAVFCIQWLVFVIACIVLEALWSSFVIEAVHLQQMPTLVCVLPV